ncbi:MAG: hypothetical protein PHV02_15675 [Rhodocyclaceae bacterium]|nr:hypothetical protein [Rhodocyclaceae bacterium]
MAKHLLERPGLMLNEAKTHIVDATQASFNFPGFTLLMSRGANTGKLRPNVRPANKSLKNVKNIGKPCAGEPHARFDEGGQARACSQL